MKPEVEVIRDWLTSVFRDVEEQEEVRVTDFTFRPLDVHRASHGEGNMVVLKRVSVEVGLGEEEKPKLYSLVVKVLPTEDRERYTLRRKFRQLLRFSKEVQVYNGVVRKMFRITEGRSLRPPLARVFHGQVDGVNDCLVLQDLACCGYRVLDPCPSLTLSHCRVMLQALAKWHALSLSLSRGTDLSTTWPWAVEAEAFTHRFEAKVAPVKETLLDYLRWEVSVGSGPTQGELEARVEGLVEDMFWEVVALRARPPQGQQVLLHGDLGLNRGLYRYVAGCPVDCKLLGLSHVGVGSPVEDLLSLLCPCLPSASCDSTCISLLLLYHSHLVQACGKLGLPEVGISLQLLLDQYRERLLLGQLMSCRVAMASHLLAGLQGQGEESLLDPDRAALYLKSAEGVCGCPTHSLRPSEQESPTQGREEGAKFSLKAIVEKLLYSRRPSSTLTSYVKLGPASPRSRSLV